MTDFVPQLFANLGKSYKDLAKKKYDYDNVLKIVNKTDFGLTLTTAGTFKKETISGNVKAAYKDKRFGDSELEVDTTSGKVFGKVGLDQLHKYTKVTVSGGFDPTSKEALVKDSWSLKGEGEYRKDFIAGGGSVLVGEESVNVGIGLEASGVIGFDGVSVGGQLKHRVGEKEPNDFNVGAQCDHKDFTATMLSEFQGDVLRFSWFHKVSAPLQLGVELLSDEFDQLSKSENPRRRTITFASQYQVDDATQAKAKGNNWGDISVAIEHRLGNPAVLLGAAAEFKAKGTSKLAADKFGLSFTFGDF